MSQHTPGPWSFWPHVLHDPENAEPMFTVGPSEFHTVADVRAGNSDDGLPEQTEANARLIAAAPELLEALIEAEVLATAWKIVWGSSPAYGNGQESPVHIAIVKKAQDAIAKATGKEDA